MNCVFARNSASNAGAVASVFGSSVALAHCTITQHGTNAVVTDFGGVCAVTNCIVFGNIGTQITTGQVVRYSDVQGGYVGAGNINTNPLFEAPAALNYALSAASPCRDAGTVCGVDHDILGAPRPVGSAPDMGAYEFVPEPGVGGALVGVAFTIYKLQFAGGGRGNECWGVWSAAVKLPL